MTRFKCIESILLKFLKSNIKYCKYTRDWTWNYFYKNTMTFSKLTNLLGTITTNLIKLPIIFEFLLIKLFHDLKNKKL